MTAAPPGSPSAASALPASSRRRGLIFLGLASALVGFAMTQQMALQANYVVEVMGLSEFQQGLLETLRESCGIAALGVLALLAGLAEPLVAAGMLVLLAVGLGAYTFVPDYAWLIVASLVWSQGVHVWMPLPNSMALALAEPGRAGHRVGQVRSAGSVGSGVGLVAALVLHRFVFREGAATAGQAIRPIYLAAAVAGLLAAGACLGIPRALKTPGPRFVFRRKYGLFYLLSFLDGWRKQIFVAFAGYLLVLRYQTPLETMLVLWIAIQAINWLSAPAVGQLIDRVGERRVLVFYFACLTVFFVGYAFVQSRHALYVLYVVDSSFFVFAMALTTYVNRIAPPSEHTPTLSMGVAFNHVGAVTMPFVGGLLWKWAGYQWAFLIGAAAAAVSVIPALLVPRRDTDR